MNVAHTARVDADADYARPVTLDEAAGLLADTDGAVPLAGGTDLMVQLRLGKRHARVVVDIAALDPLRHVDGGHDGSPTIIGSAVTMRELLSDPTVTDRYAALREAANLLGGRQIQAVATLGGNLCNASPAAETMAPLLVHRADVTVAGSHGERTVPLGRFLLGPGKVDLRHGELLKDIRLPAPDPSSRSAYRRMDLRRSVDIAIVSCAASIDTAPDGTITSARIAIGAAAPTARLVEAAAEALVGAPTEMPGGSIESSRQRRIAEVVDDAASRCADSCEPIDDVRASANYRRAMVDAIVRATLRAIMMPNQEATA